MRNLITKKSNYSLPFMGRVWGGVFLLLSLSSISLFAQSIKVNQVGYYPSETKVAVIEPTVTAKSFILKDAKGKKVWAGKAVRTSVSPFTQKVRQIVDFSTVKTPGTYTLVAGKEQQKVVIKDNAFADVAKAGMKAFYLQRTAMPIEEKYAGVYARPAAHMDNKVVVHQSAASPLRPAGTVISSPYGWYDAGDFNKYIVNSGFTIGVLLQAYELNKAYADKMNLVIPESEDAVPDFLDEVMYNLKWMITMQDPYDGGVYHKLTTPNFEGFEMPANCHQTRYVVQKSTQAALDFAASLAQAARIYSAYPKYQSFAKEAVKAAERAYAWAVKNPNFFYDQPGNNEKYSPKVNTGMYDDKASADEFFWAATELYLTTKQNSYFEQAKAFMPQSYRVPTWGEVSGLGVQQWINQSLLGKVDGIDFPVEKMKADLLAFCDECMLRMPTSSFNAPHGNREQDFPWGSNSEMCAGQGIALTYAYTLTKDHKYLSAAIADADYLLGRNATGYCFVTGFGTKQVMHPHQRLSEADGIDAPLPGFLAGGPNPGQQDIANVTTYPSKAADESYTDDVNSYASNEIAINWNAYLVGLMMTIDANLSK
jgi:endoglucanase